MSSPDTIQQLKELIEKNLALTEALAVSVKKINTYIRWQWAFFVLKVIVIAVPIILGIIYLPPLLKQSLAPYQELLGTVQNVNSAAQGMQSATNGLDINALLNEFAR